MANGSVVVVGGTVGLGRELAQAYADEGREVVVTGREQGRAETAASEIGGNTRGIGFDLAEPHAIAGALADVGAVEHLVLAAIERDVNKVQEYDIEGALRLVTLKLVGYTEVIHTLVPRLGDDSSILVFGGLARDRPYPGSTTTLPLAIAHSFLVETARSRTARAGPSVQLSTRPGPPTRPPSRGAGRLRPGCGSSTPRAAGRSA